MLKGQKLTCREDNIQPLFMTMQKFNNLIQKLTLKQKFYKLKRKKNKQKKKIIMLYWVFRRMPLMNKLKRLTKKWL